MWLQLNKHNRYTIAIIIAAQPTFNSTASTTPTVTLKTPVLSARCSATYFATAEKANIDAANSTVKLVGYLYRVKKGTSVHRQGWEVLVDVYNHPL